MNPYRSETSALPTLPLRRWSACVLGMLALSTGCGTAKELTDAATATARMASLAEPMLVRAYMLEQERCLAKPSPEDQMCITHVRAEWQRLEDSWRAGLEALCALDPEACAKEGQ